VRVRKSLVLSSEICQIVSTDVAAEIGRAVFLLTSLPAPLLQ
jgi:hypothetical protein